MAGRSTGRPEAPALQTTKPAPRRSQAVEQKIGENPCEAGSWWVCLAQSHFRILAWARLPLMPDLTREHGGVHSAQGYSGRSSLAPNDRHRYKYKVGLSIERPARGKCATAEFRSRLISSKPVSGQSTKLGSHKPVYRGLSGGLGTFRLISVQRCGSFRGKCSSIVFRKDQTLNACFMGC